ncbi:MAG TPA: hypothetical protein VMY39_08280 [Planctomycetota bacterium]|nr:hypothetical protein [Planctomycetota bacterium]
MMEPGKTYVMKPSPGFMNGRCMGCGESSTSTIGHMCLVEAAPTRRRQFLVTIEEVPAPAPSFQTTTIPGFETVWVNDHFTYC